MTGSNEQKAQETLAVLAILGLMVTSAVWGALLAISVVLTVLMPSSAWSMGMLGCAISGVTAPVLAVAPRPGIIRDVVQNANSSER